MSYRTKTYIAFSADHGDILGDMKYYNLMKAMSANEKFNFDFHDAHELNNLATTSSEETIKRKLRERLNVTKLFVILVGDDTKTKRKYVRWEIEEAIKQDIPIVVVNLNGRKTVDDTLIPPILKNVLAIHISFGEKILNYALENWSATHAAHVINGISTPRVYKDTIYSSI
jgi:Thoeris protein ThsB, TIR-like domain